MSDSGSEKDARRAIVAVIGRLENSEVVTARDEHVHPVFTSDWFGVVDDVEFVIASRQRIDVRSSARIGYYDFGVNRARVAAIRRWLTSRAAWIGSGVILAPVMRSMDQT